MHNHIGPNTKKAKLNNNKHIVFESLGITAITLGVAFIVDEAVGKTQSAIADYLVMPDESDAQGNPINQNETSTAKNTLQKNYTLEQPATQPILLIDINDNMDTNKNSLEKIQKDLNDLNKEVDQIMRSEKQTDQNDYSMPNNNEPNMSQAPIDIVKLDDKSPSTNTDKDLQEKSNTSDTITADEDEADSSSSSSFFTTPLGYLTGAALAGGGAILGTSLSGDDATTSNPSLSKNTAIARNNDANEKSNDTIDKPNEETPQLKTFNSLVSNRASQQAPDFTLTDVLGDEYSLYESFLNQGKIVVIDFYAAWCPHCQSLRDSGLLSSLAEEYADDIVVITIEAASNSTHDDLIEFYGGSLEGHSELIFEETALNSTFGLQYFPTLFAVSTTGEMLDFGSVRNEFGNHHQLYEELVAYEYAYGTVKSTKEDNTFEDLSDGTLNNEANDNNEKGEPKKMEVFDTLLKNGYTMPAPDFTLSDVLGEEYSLYESFLDESKVVVLDFYATWCTHCQNLRDTGLLSSLAEEYGDEVVVVTIEAASNSTHDDLIEFFGGSLDGHSELIFEEISLNTTFGLKYFPTLFAISSTGEMLNFGSARTEFADHHALYQELMAYEYTYGNPDGDRVENENSVACDIEGESEGCGIPTVTGEWENFPSECGEGILYEGTKTVTDFTLTDIAGNIHNFSEEQAQGTYVLINFFSAGCSHCMEGCEDDTALNQILADYDDVIIYHIEFDAKTPTEQLEFGFDGYDWSKLHNGVDEFVFNLTDNERTTIMSSYAAIDELETCGYPGLYFINSDFEMATIDRDAVTGKELYELITTYVGPLSTQQNSTEDEVNTNIDVVLSLDNLTENSIDIIYNSQVPIQAYQFNLTLDGQINTITTDLFDIVQFKEQTPGSGDHAGVGLSTTGANLPAGSGTLATISFTSNNSLALNDFTLSNATIISNQAAISSSISSANDGDNAAVVGEETVNAPEVIEEQIPTDQDNTKNLLWTEYDENTQELSIYVNLIEEACGFQMKIPGYEILDTGIGFAEDADYMHSFKDGTILGYSMSINSIEPNNGVLTTLNIQPTSEESAAPQLTNVLIVGCDDAFSELPIEILSATGSTPPATGDANDAELIEDDTLTEEPTVDKELIEDDTPTEEPTVDKELIEDDTLIEEPTVDKELIEDDTLIEEPTVDKELIEDDTLTEEPTVDKELIEDDILTEEPTADNDIDVVLSLDNLTENSIDIIYNTQVPIQAYQFSLTLDGQINTITTDLFDIVQFQEQTPDSGDHAALGLSTTGATLPAGSGTLATISFTSNNSLDLNDFTLSNATIISNQAAVSSSITSADNRDNAAVIEEQIPTDQDNTKTILWTEYDENTQELSIHVNLIEAACGFQMKIPGYEILDTGTGFAEDAEYTHSFKDSSLLGYSMSINSIDPAEGVLTTLNIQPTSEQSTTPQLTNVLIVGCDDDFSVLPIEIISTPGASPPATGDANDIELIEDDTPAEEPVADKELIEDNTPTEEPTIETDIDVVLSLDNLTENSIDIIYNTQVPIQAYQFSLTLDGQINTITTDLFDIVQFQEQTPDSGDHAALGLSTTGATLPAGSGTLATISFTSNGSLALNDFTLSNATIISNQAAVSSSIISTEVSENAAIIEEQIPTANNNTENLLWTEYDDNTQEMSIYVNLIEAACGFQMDIPGYEILDTGSGFAKDAGYIHTFQDDTILAYSMSMNTIDPGKGVLITLNIQPTSEQNVAPQLSNVLIVGCDNDISALPIEIIPAPDATPPVTDDANDAELIGDNTVTEEPTVDTDLHVVLSLDNLTANSIDVIYNAQAPIEAYKFGLTLDGQINSVTTNSFDAVQFQEQAPESGDYTTIGLSTAGATLPTGSNTLATISFTSNKPLALNDFILRDTMIIANQTEVSSSIVSAEVSENSVVIEDEIPPAQDNTKNLLWTEYDENTQEMSIHVNLMDAACGFQMDIPGYEILDTGIGLAKDAGYIHTFQDDTILAYSMSMNTIDSGEGVLTTLNIQPTSEQSAAPQLANVLIVGCDNNFSTLPIEIISAPDTTPPVTDDSTDEELIDDDTPTEQPTIDKELIDDDTPTEEPTIDNDIDVFLSLDNLTENSIDIIYNAQVPIQAYQFNLALDGQINTITTDLFDIVQFQEQTPGSGDHAALGLSSESTTLPAGSGTLATISFTSNNSLALNDFTLSNMTIISNQAEVIFSISSNDDRNNAAVIEDEIPPAQDNTKNLLWTEYDENTQEMSIHVNLIEEACGFQLDIPGYEILDTGTGLAKESGYIHTFKDDTLLAYSMSMNTINPGGGVLTTVNIQPTSEQSTSPQLTNVLIVGCDNAFSALPVEIISAPDTTPPASDDSIEIALTLNQPSTPAMIDLIENFVAPDDMAPVADYLSSLCEPGQTCFIMLGDELTTENSSTGEFTITNQSGQTLLSSDNTAWTPNENISGTHAILTLDEIPTNATTFNFHLTDSEGNGWSDANSGTAEIAGGIWLHHPNGDTELLHLFNEGFARDIELTLHPEDDDSIF